MKKLIGKLNLVDLTNAYGMSESSFKILGRSNGYKNTLAETRYSNDRLYISIHLKADRCNIFSPVAFQTTPEDDIIKRVETVGKVQPHVKAKIIDESGNIVPVGMPGEICIAGYLLQKG